MRIALILNQQEAVAYVRDKHGIRNGIVQLNRATFHDDVLAETKSLRKYYDPAKIDAWIQRLKNRKEYR